MATATQQPDVQETAELNGWKLDALQATLDTVKEQPEAGKLTWRCHVAWDAGFGLDAHPSEIEQLGQIMPRKFTLRGDHPPELLGQNTGPTAVETLLAALGSCIAGTYAAHATARGIRIDELEVDLEGQIDLSGFLQISSVRPGLSQVRTTVRVKSDADEAALQELLDVTRSASPVFDTVTKPVAIESSVARIS